MKLKHIAKIIIACILLLTLLTVCGKIFMPDHSFTTSDNQAFYEAPKNSVDVIFVGSSGVLRGVSPLLIYKETGIASWSRASVLQAPHITYLNVQEALKTQRPKIVFISTLCLFKMYRFDLRETYLRVALDHKKMSMEKLAAAAETVTHSKEQSFLSYLFPILRYHSRWNEVLEEGPAASRASEFAYAKGQVYYFKSHAIEPLTGKIDPYQEQQASINSWSENYYTKSIQLCKEHGVKVVLFTMPRGRWSSEKYRAVKAFADRNQVDYLDLNLDEALQELDLDFKKEFSDVNHLNAWGSAKAAKYLGAYLTEECGMKPSQKSPAVLKDYEKGYKRLIKEIQAEMPGWTFPE